MKTWDELSIKDKNDIIKVAVQNGITALPDIRERYNEFAEGGDTNGPRFQQSQEAYYDRDTDTIYAPDSIGEFYRHEAFHARPDSVELERLKPYYDNLDDNRLLELGADLPFVKRMDNDPGHFYSPEEVGARVSAARYMLNNAGVNNVDNVFLEEARKNENAYGNNFRDLLHMYNNENLIGIFGKGYSSGGKIHIKEKNRGKFTALKERTGHSASWFKAHGTPAQRKMATFALNARKWKHGDGGHLYDEGGHKFSNTPVGRAMQRQYDKEQGIVAQRVLPEVEVMPNPYVYSEDGYGFPKRDRGGL